MGRLDRMARALGIDVGGSGIKGAPVDLEIGDFATDRIKIPTPGKSTPKNVATVIREIVDNFAGELDDDAPIGVTIPAVVTHGVSRSAANIDKKWIDFPIGEFLTDRLEREVVVVNDADAAGVAENEFGAAKDVDGVVVLTTLGTGIGTAVINHGQLLPNTEFGHLEMNGGDAEKQAAASRREIEDLSWQDWAARLQQYYTMLENLLWPDLIVVGGGVSRKAEKFLPLLDLRTEIIPARLQNRAGIVGAAWLAHTHYQP